jgi:hypothetical protein
VTTEKYKTVSHIHVDVADLPYHPAWTPLGTLVFIRKFEVIYIYGSTAEIKAQIAWKDGVRLLRTHLTTDIPLTTFPLLQGVEKRCVCVAAMGHALY